MQLQSVKAKELICSHYLRYHEFCIGLSKIIQSCEINDNYQLSSAKSSKDALQAMVQGQPTRRATLILNINMSSN